jgi:hypothetical protein
LGAKPWLKQRQAQAPHFNNAFKPSLTRSFQ